MVFDNDDYLKQTIRKAMSAPLLAVEKEIELAHRWLEKGDKKALNELTQAHMRMAVSTAIKFRGYGLPIADLIQEGAIGLLEAAKRFDPDREVRFGTYAGWWIRASMQDYILRNWSIVRIGSKSAHKTIFFNLSRVRAMIEKTDSTPRIGRVAAAKRFRVTEQDVEFMTSRLSRRDQSLNAPLGEEGDTEYQDFIPDTQETPDVKASANIDGDKRQRLLKLAMEKLNERERLIIQNRFFLDDKVTLADIGGNLKLSKERVRQIEKQAILKLSEHFAQPVLKDAL
ncbi:MAG: RNA polymerase factor sigma-32 [Pseudomonadota bacterium]